MLTTGKYKRKRRIYFLTYLEKNGESLLQIWLKIEQKNLQNQPSEKQVRELAVKKKVYRTNEETGNSKAKYNLVKE